MDTKKVESADLIQEDAAATESPAASEHGGIDHTLMVLNEHAQRGKLQFVCGSHVDDAGEQYTLMSQDGHPGMVIDALYDAGLGRQTEDAARASSGAMSDKEMDDFMAIGRRAVLPLIDAMKERFDKGETCFAATIEITPAGDAHLYWGSRPDGASVRLHRCPERGKVVPRPRPR